MGALVSGITGKFNLYLGYTGLESDFNNACPKKDNKKFRASTKN
jgi:hypothetical protein